MTTLPCGGTAGGAAVLVHGAVLAGGALVVGIVMTAGAAGLAAGAGSGAPAGVAVSTGDTYAWCAGACPSVVVVAAAGGQARRQERECERAGFARGRGVSPVGRHGMAMVHSRGGWERQRRPIVPACAGDGQDAPRVGAGAGHGHARMDRQGPSHRGAPYAA